MPTNTRSSRSIAAILAGVIAVTSAFIASAQPDASPRIDGRGFSGVNLPQPIETYGLSFRAVRGHTWRESGALRLLLDRNVDVTIGLYRFRASSAVIWLELVEVEGREAMQLAAYFTDVDTPARAFGIEQSADSLLVTAVTYDIRTTLALDDRIEGRPTSARASGLLRAGEARFARHLAQIVNPESEPLAERTPAERTPRGTVDVMRDGPVRTREQVSEASERPAWLDDDPRENVPAAAPRDARSPQRGSVTFDATDIQYRAATPEGGGPAVILQGGFVVQYRLADSAQAVQLTADSAVVFLEPSTESGRLRYDPQDVRGIYLEGGVTIDSEGQSLRANKVFYDIATERGVLIDGVFKTYQEEFGNPIVLRAEQIRQLSATQWSAHNAELANVSFAEPHFAIGATDITVTRRVRDGVRRTYVEAEGVGFRIGETTVLSLPRMRGEVKASPLREVQGGREGGSALLRTNWDLYALLGVEGPEDTTGTLLVDGYFERGVGVGTDFEWKTDDFEGSLFAYYAYTEGEDELTSGADIDPDSAHRGLILGENIWHLTPSWTLFTEIAYLSDETFVDAFFEPLAETRREFTNSFLARYLDEQSVFTLEARASLNDFIANEYLLQSLGYQTERLPEARYARFADPIFGDLVSYSSDTRAGLVRLNFNEPTAAEQGFNTARRSLAGFGILPTASLADGLRTSGLTEDEVARFDTRHEFEIPLRAGALNIVPYAVGRFTAWDDDFDSFAGRDNESYRLWGAAGVRLSTSMQKVYEDFESELFDAHRLRHIIEPSLNIWHASTDYLQEHLPIYDDGVESIAQGTAFQVGVTNTLQTMRGMPGRRRSVDWVTMRSTYQWSSNEVTTESPFGRFISYRPEHSNLGRFFRNETVWNLTDSVTLINDFLYDSEIGRVASNVIGAEIDHGLGFATFVEYRELDPIDAAFFRLGGRHELTSKYALGLAGNYDFDRDRFQSISAFITRRFPQWTMDVILDLDNITDNVGLGVSLRPVGFGTEKRLRPFASGLTSTEAISGLRNGRGRLDKGPFAQ